MVQHYEVGERARAADVYWDPGSDHPSIFSLDGLTAERALPLLLMPKSFGKAAIQQPRFHPLVLPFREVGVPGGVERISFRFNLDMADDLGVCG
jgi:hypothetical protein